MRKIAVGRSANGLTLKPLEYLLDECGELKLFDSAELAKAFLKDHGYSDGDLDWIVFEEVYDYGG